MKVAKTVREMPPSTLFVDQDTGEFDFDQILSEAIPIAKLIGVFVAIALVPFAIAFTFGSGLFFALLGQFILAVGIGVVLLYLIVRGIQLADE